MTEMRTDLFSLPGSDAYRTATTPHNATVTQRPARVAHPHNADELSTPCGGPPNVTYRSPCRPADTAPAHRSTRISC